VKAPWNESILFLALCSGSSDRFLLKEWPGNGRERESNSYLSNMRSGVYFAGSIMTTWICSIRSRVTSIRIFAFSLMALCASASQVE